MAELLLVVCVFALLAAMLLPALGRSRAKARDTRCLSQLKQLQLGWTLYSSDYADKIVRTGGLEQLVSDPNDPDGLPGGARSQWVLGRVDALPAATNALLVQAGLLYPFVRNVAAFKCPADRKTAEGAPTVRSRSMNCWMNPIRDWNSLCGYGETNSLRVFRKQADLVRPSPAQCWVVIDEAPQGINDGWFVCDPNDTNTWTDLPASYHRGAGGLSFADGHAEIKDWPDSAVPGTSAPGATNETRAVDLLWLQARTTSRQ